MQDPGDLTEGSRNRAADHPEAEEIDREWGYMQLLDGTRYFCSDDDCFCEIDDEGRCAHCSFDRALGDDPDYDPEEPS